MPPSTPLPGSGGFSRTPDATTGVTDHYRTGRDPSRGFVAIDGEATTEAGVHRYVMLIASDGSIIADEAGLGTARCLAFLLRLRAAHPRARLVAFGLSYDVNMILRDLTLDEVRELWDEGTLRWRDYILDWTPGKLFRVGHVDAASGRVAKGTWAGVSDVFGFFQTRFVRALEVWGIPDPEGLVERMKGERSSFTWDRRLEVGWYCYCETKLLVSLMDELEAALDSAGIKVARWLGAGSVASAMLRQGDILRDHVPDHELPLPVQNAVMRGYFGGRVEILRAGVFAPAVSYDLRSAYPTICATLPSLNGRWRRSRTYRPLEAFAVWRVSWNVTGPLCPFPFRLGRSIHYPTGGQGWYWAAEVAAAIAVFGDAVRVHEGYVLTPDDPHARPFHDLVTGFYAERQRRAGEPAGRVIKLGLNSIYGKLAQGNSRWGIPRQRSYVWAGMVTAGTRARMLLLAAVAGHGQVIGFATDAVTIRSRHPALDELEGPGLGALDCSEYARLFVAQPGFSRGYDAEGLEVYRTRGWMTHEVDWDDLEAGWTREGPFYVQERLVTRFIGAGALMAGTGERWRTWSTGPRRLSLYPTSKFVDSWQPGDREVTFTPCGTPGRLSDPYTPKDAAIGLELELLDSLIGLEQPELLPEP